MPQKLKTESQVFDILKSRGIDPVCRIGFDGNAFFPTRHVYLYIATMANDILADLNKPVVEVNNLPIHDVPPQVQHESPPEVSPLSSDTSKTTAEIINDNQTTPKIKEPEPMPIIEPKIEEPKITTEVKSSGEDGGMAKPITKGHRKGRPKGKKQVDT